MVYFKFEFTFRWFGNKKRERKCSNAIPAWEFINQEVERVSQNGQYKTAVNYRTAANSFSAFMGNRQWHFCDMQPVTMEAYQQWLKEKGISLNTSSCYMRSLRTLYNRAAGHDLVTDCQPFSKVFTGKEKTCKRSALEEDILKLSRLSLPQGSSIAFARDIFLFSFYAMGMPFVDVAFLKKSQVSTSVIRYARHKTGQEITVAMEPCMQEIINRYTSVDTEYVFPILAQPISQETYKQYQSQLRNYNHALHRLSAMIDASRTLSSYIVRHSWASIAYRHNMDMSLISRALGHTNTATTFIYIRDLFNPELADANHKLLEDFT